MNRSVEQKLLDLYVANVDIIGEGFPAFVNRQRREFIEAFNLCSLPDRHDERYRLSDMRELFGSREWEHYFIPPPAKISGDEEEDFPEGRYTFVLQNGFSAADGAPLQVLDNGMIFGSLRAAANEYPELVGAYYNTAADNKNDTLTALNSAFMQDGSFFYLPDGVEPEEPLHFRHEYSASSEDVAGFGRMLLVCGAKSRAQVQIVHRTCGLEASKGGYLADCVCEILAGEGAQIAISETALFEAGGHLVLNSYIRQQAGSRCEAHLIDLGGGTVRINSRTDLAGPGAESYLYGLYLHTGSEKCDMDVAVNHLASDCRSYELVKGVAAGEATGAFAGRVCVAPDAQRTEASQQNRNLLLSDTARIYTKPQLEIYADDVKCSHGATVGQLDDDAIYYMRQRGIGIEEARRLQLDGFVDDILSHCECEQCCDWMKKRAHEKILSVTSYR